ncbi:MAG: hypothetical protein IJF88_10340 [Oscillospiraceae bacterium]|nr:hypothetical protein [Oscillospiraceae bacterium]
MRIEDVLVKAEPYLCVPAVLETVFKFFGIHCYNQQSIASCFAVHVPPCAKQMVKNPVIDDNPSNWGIRIDKDGINQLFRRLEIPLREKFISITEIMDEVLFEEKLDSILKVGHVAICGYNYSALYGSNNGEFRHVSIIVSLNKDNDEVLIADPGPKGYGLQRVKIENLFFSIRRAGDGVWEIEPGSVSELRTEYGNTELKYNGQNKARSTQT